MDSLAGNIGNVSSIMPGRPVFIQASPLQTQFMGSPLQQPPSHHQICNNSKPNAGPFFNCHAPQSTVGQPVLFRSPHFASQVNRPSLVAPSCDQSQNQISQINSCSNMVRFVEAEMQQRQLYYQQQHEHETWQNRLSQLNAATTTMCIDPDRQMSDTSQNGPAVVAMETPWQHRVPQNVPWSVRSPPEFTRSAELQACPDDQQRFIQNGVCSKRKADTEYSPCKQFISEEKMAAKMRALQINDKRLLNRRHMIKADAQKILQEIDDRLDIEDDEEIEKDTPTVLSIDHPELKQQLENTWKESRKMLPAALLKQVKSPCTALVLWQQPSDFVEKIIKDSSLPKQLPPLSVNELKSQPLNPPLPVSVDRPVTSLITPTNLGQQHMAEKVPDMDTAFFHVSPINTMPFSRPAPAAITPDIQDFMDLQDDDL